MAGSRTKWLTAAGILAAAALLAGRRQIGAGLTAITGPMPARFKGVPFATGAPALWPLAVQPGGQVTVSYLDIHGKTHGSGARRFGAPREGVRYHVGIDLYADAGDVVRAIEGGVVVATQTFKLGTHALLVQGDSGLVVNYGELDAGSWAEFGVGEGKRVTAGQPVGRVGLSSSGSHMLHLETYRQGTTENVPWYMGKPAPPAVLDPTLYLLQAAARSGAKVKS